jgi:hypothetical protein
MARKGSVSFVELHVEKGVLGLAVLFAVFLAVRYLILEPNKVEFGGEKLGPSQLDEALVHKADDLARAVQNAQPAKAPVAEYAKQLEDGVKSGLFGVTDSNSPPLPEVLSVAAQFGTPLPTIEEGLEIDDVALVTPVKPEDPIATTGISLAYRRSPLLPTGTGGSAAPGDDEPEEPEEVSWVTVAAYFPLDEQQTQMNEAGYAGYRAKPYVVGVDVQRQEMTASGEYSDWADVAAGKAMPKIDLPKPEYNEKGELRNQADLDEKFDTIKRLQPVLEQPTFYAVEAGDQWSVPPLPGLESTESEEPNEPGIGPEAPNRETSGRRGAPPVTFAGRRNAPVGGGARVGGGGGRMPGAPYGGARGGGARVTNPFVQQTAPRKTNPRKVILEDLRDARKALRTKDWDHAQQLANSVLGKDDASKTDKAQAERILREADKGRKLGQKQPSARATTAGIPTPTPVPFVTDPEAESSPAVWFHDDSVEAGKTYRYRMRVKLWNRYVGRRASLRDPTQADQTVLLGAWSDATAPLTVAPHQQFFVRGQAYNEPAAMVDVFTWYKGDWIREDFKVRVGDMIGEAKEVKTPEVDEDGKPQKDTIDFSTGAVVLDLRFEDPILVRRPTKDEFRYLEGKTVVLVYLDPADGQVKEHAAELDKYDPLYKKLKEDWEAIKPGS